MGLRVQNVCSRAASVQARMHSSDAPTLDYYQFLQTVLKIKFKILFLEHLCGCLARHHTKESLENMRTRGTPRGSSFSQL